MSSGRISGSGMPLAGTVDFLTLGGLGALADSVTCLECLSILLTWW